MKVEFAPCWVLTFPEGQQCFRLHENKHPFKINPETCEAAVHWQSVPALCRAVLCCAVLVGIQPCKQKPAGPLA